MDIFEKPFIASFVCCLIFLWAISDMHCVICIPFHARNNGSLREDVICEYELGYVLYVVIVASVWWAWQQIYCIKEHGQCPHQITLPIRRRQLLAHHNRVHYAEKLLAY